MSGWACCKRLEATPLAGHEESQVRKKLNSLQPLMTTTQSEYGWALTAVVAAQGSGVGSDWSYRSVVSPEVEWSQRRELFWKHKRQSSEFKLLRRVLPKALLKRLKHSCKSRVKYSLRFFLFSLRNHPEVWECAREHDWYIISVSGLWPWTWPSHFLLKRRNISSFLCLNIQ